MRRIGFSMPHLILDLSQTLQQLDDATSQTLIDAYALTVYQGNKAVSVPLGMIYFSFEVGRFLAAQGSQRAVVQTTGRGTHKCVRTQDSVHGTKTLLANPRGQACIVRRDRTSTLYQVATQGDQVSSSFVGGTAAAHLGPSSSLELLVEWICCRFCIANVDLFASERMMHYPLLFSLGGESSLLGHLSTCVARQPSVYISSNSLVSSNPRLGCKKQPQFTTGCSQLARKTAVFCAAQTP